MKVHRRSGFSLIEVMIAITMLGVIAGSIALVTRSSSKAFSTAASAAEVETQAHRAMQQIKDLVKGSVSTLVNPTPASPFNTEQITFQRATGYVAGAPVADLPEQILLEYMPGEVDDGIDNNGNGHADEGQVVWIRTDGTRVVLVKYVREYLEGEAFNLVDDNGNGLDNERGFCMDFDGNTVNVRLTIERRNDQGIRLTSTVESAISFRN